MALNTNEEKKCLHQIISDHSENYIATITSLFKFYYEDQASPFKRKCSVIRVVISIYIDFFEMHEHTKSSLTDSDKKKSAANMFFLGKNKNEILTELNEKLYLSWPILGKEITMANIDRFISQTMPSNKNDIFKKPSDNYMLKLWLEFQKKVLSAPESYFNEFLDDDFRKNTSNKITKKIFLLLSNYSLNQSVAEKKSEEATPSTPPMPKIDFAKARSSQQDKEVPPAPGLVKKPKGSSI